MKKILFAFLITSLFLIPLSSVFAQETYTINDISKHNKPEDCWIVVDQNVYDITNYLEQHDEMLDIRSWCGTDATEDYNTKNRTGKSHSVRADNLLAGYIIGTLVSENDSDTSVVSDTKTVAKPVSNTKGYNVILPFFGTILLYVISLKLINRQTHNFIWNSIMLLGLIPSFGFGMIMALSRQFTWMKSLVYKDMLASHVGLSTAFGTLCILHLLLRFKVFIAQGRVSFKR